MTRSIEVTRAWLGRHPLPRPNATGDKEQRGQVLVVGGSAKVPGAVLLAGVAALRAGAGKLQLATVGSASIALGVAVVTGNGSSALGSRVLRRSSWRVIRVTSLKHICALMVAGL